MKNAGAISNIKSQLAIDKTDSYNGDLNNISKTSIYYANSPSTNKPLNVNGYVSTIVTNSDYITQHFTTYDGYDFTRVKNDGTWTSWQKVGIAPTMTFLSNSQTRSTSFVELNDMKVSIPAGSYFIATLRLFYEYSSVAEIGIGNYSSSSIEDGCQVRKLNTTSQGYVHNPSVTYTGYTAVDTVMIGYGRWDSSATNRAQLFVMRWPAGSYNT